MTYDEFAEKLSKIELEYDRVYNKKLETVEELKAHLMRRRIRQKKGAGAKSLKGLF